MSRPDIVKAAEAALANDWTLNTVNPLSAREVEERLPLALIVQTALHLLPSIPAEAAEGRAANWIEAGRYRKAADSAIDLIDNCFLAREDVKRKVRDRLAWEKEVFGIAGHLPFPKGVNYITGSKTLKEKLPAFRGWLNYMWLNMPDDFFNKSYPALTMTMQSAQSSEDFAEAAIEVLKEHGFNRFAAVEFQARFQNFYQYWTTEQRRAGGKKSATLKKKLAPKSGVRKKLLGG